MTAFGGLTPSISSQKTIKYRVLSYQYGNGYEQRAPDGANPMVESWQINFDNLDSTRTTTLQTWLDATPPYTTFVGDGVILSSSKSYWMDKNGYSVQALAGGVNSFVINITQVY